MKKVYASGRIVIFVGLFFGVTVYLPFAGKGPINFNGIYSLVLSPYGLLLLIFGAPFLLCVLAYFYPNWVYDENGFEMLYGYFKGKYRWEDVKKICFSPALHATYDVRTGDGKFLWIGRFTTKDYLKVMSDVVRYVCKKSPGAEIDPRILKKMGRVQKSG